MMRKLRKLIDAEYTNLLPISQAVLAIAVRYWGALPGAAHRRGFPSLPLSHAMLAVPKEWPPMRATSVIIPFLFTLACHAADTPWNLDALSQPPAYTAAEGFIEPGVSAIYYDGPAYQGKPTKVFAWYGLPKLAAGEKVPAMVLVHGGGGTAFAEWVRLWTSRGYAAIAMDTCGGLPRGGNGKWEENPNGGPHGWGGFDKANDPVTDQWPYHAIADVILAHSLIRSFPEVDAERTGLTGISWGGYLTCIAAGVDPRFKFAAPVYGCGFLGDNSAWLDAFASLPKETATRWLSLWDPSVYLHNAALPMLWVTGTNDFAYPLDSLQKSYRLPTGPRTLAIRLRMPHGHGGAGENPEEIHAFANHLFKAAPPLAQIASQGRDGNTAWATYDAATPIASAELLYTTATGKWQDRPWEAIPAELDAEAGKARATLPEGCTVYYLNLIDAQGNTISAEHETLKD
jgi:dienelactone hydrolase